MHYLGEFKPAAGFIPAIGGKAYFIDEDGWIFRDVGTTARQYVAQIYMGPQPKQGVRWPGRPINRTGHDGPATHAAA